VVLFMSNLVAVALGAKLDERHVPYELSELVGFLACKSLEWLGGRRTKLTTQRVGIRQIMDLLCLA
jgi:hypothetical protein